MAQLNTFLIFQILSYLYPILLGQIFTGIIFKVARGWEKITGSDKKYTKPHVLFVYAIIDTIVCSFIIAFSSSMIAEFLYSHWNVVLGVTVELVLASFLWFCHSISLKTKKTLKRYWKPIVALQAIAVLNFYLVYTKLI